MRGCAARVLPLWASGVWSHHCRQKWESWVFEKMTVKVRRIVWSQIMYDSLLLLFEKWYPEL